jgi:hypothetical protein
LAYFCPVFKILAMKLHLHNLLVFTLMIITAAIYRAVPFESRPEWLGAPQLAMAIFAGSVVAKRSWAFAFPLLSMLVSDGLMQLIHIYNPTQMPGFYKGQLLNYVLIASITVVGFFTNHRKPAQIFGALLTGPIVYFLLSNFAVWAGGGGLGRPGTSLGLLQCYGDGLPFLFNSLAGTAIFGAAFFGVYHLAHRAAMPEAKA